MYRTHKLQQLILKGIPEKLRGEVWMTYSGAINEVRVNVVTLHQVQLSNLPSFLLKEHLVAKVMRCLCRWQ